MDKSFFINIENKNKPGELIIKGSFNVPALKDGITVAGPHVLKHIILVVTRSDNYHSVTPFKDVMVFKDDVKVDGKSCPGFFNINLKEHSGFDGEGDYYCSCSLGTYLSNTVKISV